MIIQGSTSTVFVSSVTTTATASLNFMLTNIAAVPVNINIYIKSASVYTRVAPKNLQLLAGESFELKDLAFFKSIIFKIDTTGSTEYYVWTS